MTNRLWTKINTASFFQTAVRLRLFIISYVPLFVMFAVLAFPKSPGWPPSIGDLISKHVALIAWIVLSIFGIGNAIWLVKKTLRKGSRDLPLSDLNDESGAASGYLATYLLPLLALSPSDWRECVAYFVYVAIAGFLFVSSNMGLVNPTLYFLGWRTVSATLTVPSSQSSDGKELDPRKEKVFLICRRDSAPKCFKDAQGQSILNVVKSTGIYLFKD